MNIPEPTKDTRSGFLNDIRSARVDRSLARKQTESINIIITYLRKFVGKTRRKRANWKEETSLIVQCMKKYMDKQRDTTPQGDQSYLHAHLLPLLSVHCLNFLSLRVDPQRMRVTDWLAVQIQWGSFVSHVIGTSGNGMNKTMRGLYGRDPYVKRLILMCIRISLKVFVLYYDKWEGVKQRGVYCLTISMMIKEWADIVHDNVSDPYDMVISCIPLWLIYINRLLSEMDKERIAIQQQDNKEKESNLNRLQMMKDKMEGTITYIGESLLQRDHGSPLLYDIIHSILSKPNTPSSLSTLLLHPRHHGFHVRVSELSPLSFTCGSHCIPFPLQLQRVYHPSSRSTALPPCQCSIIQLGNYIELLKGRNNKSWDVNTISSLKGPSAVEFLTKLKAIYVLFTHVSQYLTSSSSPQDPQGFSPSSLSFSSLSNSSSASSSSPSLSQWNLDILLTPLSTTLSDWLRPLLLSMIDTNFLFSLIPLMFDRNVASNGINESLSGYSLLIHGVASTNSGNSSLIRHLYPLATISPLLSLLAIFCNNLGGTRGFLKVILRSPLLMVVKWYMGEMMGALEGVTLKTNTNTTKPNTNASGSSSSSRDNTGNNRDIEMKSLSYNSKYNYQQLSDEADDSNENDDQYSDTRTESLVLSSSLLPPSSSSKKKTKEKKKSKFSLKSLFGFSSSSKSSTSSSLPPTPLSPGDTLRPIRIQWEVSLLSPERNDTVVITPHVLFSLFIELYSILPFILHDNDLIHSHAAFTSLAELKQFIRVIKIILFRMVWWEGEEEGEGEGGIVIRAIWRNKLIEIINELYRRDIRIQYMKDSTEDTKDNKDSSNDSSIDVSFLHWRIHDDEEPLWVSTWRTYIYPPISPDSPTDDVKVDPRVYRVLSILPFVIPFKDRLYLFKSFIVRDKKRTNPLAWTLLSNNSNRLGYTMFQYLQFNHIPYNNISVRRSNLLYDSIKSINELGTKFKDLVKVSFIDDNTGQKEEGIDLGGVFKEFLEEVIEHIFDPNLGIFKVLKYEQKDGESGNSNEDNMGYSVSLNPDIMLLMSREEVQYYCINIGRIIGKSLYEGILLDIPFSLFFLHKLIKPMGSPSSILYFPDLIEYDPALYHSLLKVKQYEGDDIVDLFSLSFAITREFCGVSRTFDLVTGGADVMVDQHNKYLFLYKYSDWLMNTNPSLCVMLAAFKQGFNEIIPTEWISIFNNVEFQYICSGDSQCMSDSISIAEWRQYTYLEGIQGKDKALTRQEGQLIEWWWDVVEKSLNVKERRALLKFTTSCSRPPLGGFKNLQPGFCIRIVKMDEKQQGRRTRGWGERIGRLFSSSSSSSSSAVPSSNDSLPSASTCFNMLKLPLYPSKTILLEKIKQAIQYNSGFHLA